MYKIEKGVKPPNGKENGKSKYPLDEMKVGDSFLVDTIDQRNNCYSAAKYYAIKHNGFKLMTAHEGDKYRVWRIK